MIRAHLQTHTKAKPLRPRFAAPATDLLFTYGPEGKGAEGPKNPKCARKVYESMS